jgi:hypothetical protein
MPQQKYKVISEREREREMFYLTTPSLAEIVWRRWWNNTESGKTDVL